MSELDDLEEIDLGPSRNAGRKRVRNGRKFFLMGIERSVNRPKWKHQLSVEKGWDAPSHKRAPGK